MATRKRTGCLSAFAWRWAKLQISHCGGKYSVERMLQLGEYTTTKSLPHVLLVCVATPIPMIALIMLQELTPLQDPNDGWQANYGVWIRLGILAGAIAGSIAVHAMHMIDGVSLSNCQVAEIAAFVGLTFPFVGMLVAALWVFPVPFFALLLDTLFVVETVGAFRFIVGRDIFNQIIQQRYQGLRCFQFITVQMLLALVYPAYQVLFGVASGTSFELPVILLLPVVKLAMKNLLSYTIPHLEDIMPVEVIFVVDFFNAFYLVTCVQSASSTSAVVTILIIDISQSMLEIYRMYGRTRSIAVKINRAVDHATMDSLALLNVAQMLCENPEKLALHIHPGIRLRSNPALRTQRHNWLSNLETTRQSEAKSSHASPDSSIIVRNSPAEPARSSLLFGCVGRCGCHRSQAVAPMSGIPMLVKPSTLDHPRNEGPSTTTDCLARQSPQILSEVLEMLFTLECLVLTEYLEAIVPVLYGCYVKVLVYLPSAKYHIELEGTTVENVDSRVQSVFVYAAMEFLSLAELLVIFYKNCGMRALYQLAFVLEAQMKLVQSMLVIWTLITLCFRVVHFGTRFFIFR
jgi:hypothetical protein